MYRSPITQMIFHFLLLFHGTFAFYAHYRNPGVTSGNNNIDPGVNSGMNTRRKRLVYGLVVYEDDQELYPLAKYQAALINAHWCSEEVLEELKKHTSGERWDKWQQERLHVKDMIFSHCPITKTRAYCGGTAITELAIQTACHCIARFTFSKDQTPARQTHPYNAWEDLIYSVIGAIDFRTSNTPYTSKEFLLHEKCLEIENITITHDIGIIVLRYRLDIGVAIAAPTTTQEMVKQWYYVSDKEVVCQVVGWGSSEFEGRDIFGSPSTNLRLTWRVIRSFVYCYDGHRSMAGFVWYININKLNYKDVQSWSCSTDFGKLKSFIAPVDNGGPVSCVQGWYFGVMSWGLHAYDVNDSAFSLTVQTDIVYALYENSWNFRTSFQKYIHEKFEKPTYPTFKPRLLLRSKRSEEEYPIDIPDAPSRSTDFHHSCLFSLLLFLRCLN